MRLLRTRARRVVAVVLAGGGVLAATAIAGNGPPDNQYEGRAEGDTDTYVGFDVVRQNGKRKIKGVTAFLHYECQGGGSAADAFLRAKGRIRVNDRGRFNGKVADRDLPPPIRGAAARGAPSEVSYRFRGKLRNGGRAKGRIDANIKPFLEPEIRCYSGDLDWRARRGAETDPNP